MATRHFFRQDNRPSHNQEDRDHRGGIRGSQEREFLAGGALLLAAAAPDSREESSRSRVFTLGIEVGFIGLEIPKIPEQKSGRVVDGW